MPTTPCPTGCGNTRAPRQYLCRTCWFHLPTDTRSVLNQPGSGALAHLRELLDQIHAGVPLADIRIG